MLKVRVTAYKGLLVIDTEPPFERTETFIPRGGTQIGCTLLGTKDQLGISEEALVLLQTVRKSHDAIGDLMWWKAGDQFCFGWIGGVKSLKDPSICEGDRDYGIHPGEYVTIPNDVPEGAKTAIDNDL